MKKLFALALLGAAAAGTRLVADEGRIPISTPTTITKSGHYIVTRDLFINGPGSILAIGNNHVTIDLNGFSLQSLNGTDPVIRSLGGFGSLTIRNGTVEGGSAGILFPAGGTVDVAKCRHVLRYGLSGDYLPVERDRPVIVTTGGVYFRQAGQCVHVAGKGLEGGTVLHLGGVEIPGVEVEIGELEMIPRLALRRCTGVSGPAHGLLCQADRLLRVTPEFG